MQRSRIQRPHVPASRRHFLRFGSAAVLGISLAKALECESVAGERGAGTATAENVILIWLEGGPSTIDMWDMKPTAPIDVRGEFQPISTTVPDLQVCEHLPRLAKVLDRCTLVRSVSHTLAEHGIGQSYLATGHSPNPALTYPSLGSLASRLLPESDSVPSYLTLGGQPNAGAGFLGSAYDPFEVMTFPFTFSRRPTQTKTDLPSPDRIASLPHGFTLDDLRRRERVLAVVEKQFNERKESPIVQTLGRFQQRALDMLLSGKVERALDLTGQSDRLRKSYGDGRLGYSALAALNLIEAGVRFVTIGLRGWDTHSDNFAQLQYRLLPDLDHALSGLLFELDERGLLDTTIVYCVGEFGRTPRVNPLTGRDHWPRVTSVLLAGGGFKRGFAYGAADDRGYDIVENPCSPQDVSATIFQSLGFQPDCLVSTSTPGRREQIFREASVLKDLLS